jgi:hypothetical protein
MYARLTKETCVPGALIRLDSVYNKEAALCIVLSYRGRDNDKIKFYSIIGNFYVHYLNFPFWELLC